MNARREIAMVMDIVKMASMITLAYANQDIRGRTANIQVFH